MRTHRPGRRLLRQAQTVSQRGLLQRADLPVDGFSDDHVPGTVRHSAHVRLDRAMGRDAARPGTENRAAAAGVPGPRAARLHLHREPSVTNYRAARTTLARPRY